MQVKLAPVRSSGGSTITSPVLAGGEWFGDGDGPLRLRLELPLSAEQLVAGLYLASRWGMGREELTRDEAVWGFAALAVTGDGLTAVNRAVAELAVEEQRQAIPAADQEWLTFLRRRVADVTGVAA